MDQAEGIRNVIKLQNQQMTPKARVINEKEKNRKKK